MQQHGGPLPWGWCQNSSFFSEYSHVAYQNNGSYKCRNMVENVLPADPHPRPPFDPIGSKGHNSTFSEHGHGVEHHANTQSLLKHTL